MKNHILPAAIKRMGLFYKQKKNLYLLVMILNDFILYGDGIIHFETGPIKVIIERWEIVINFDVLLLGKNEAVLGMPFLQEFNLKIDWITGEVEITDTKNWKT